MIFVIGGAYQGKLEFALKSLADQSSRVFTCDQQTLEIDWSCLVIDQLQSLIWAHQQAGLDPLAYLQSNHKKLKDKILICEDVSSGVVPIDTQTRLWREWVGRCSVWLARESDQVFRVFCGLSTPLKA